MTSTFRRTVVFLVGPALVLAGCGSEVTEGGGGAPSTTSTSSTASGGAGALGGAGGNGAVGGAGGAAGAGVAGSAGSGAGGGPALCNPNGVICATAPPDCPPGEVVSVDGECWGPCVPILSCETEPSCDDCPGAFCVEYQAWTTEYRCVLPTLQCSATTCSCLSSYFCVEPFDACAEGSVAGSIVTCECPTC